MATDQQISNLLQQMAAAHPESSISIWATQERGSVQY